MVVTEKMKMIEVTAMAGEDPHPSAVQSYCSKAKNEWNVNAMLYLTEISGSSTHLSAV